MAGSGPAGTEGSVTRIPPYGPVRVPEVPPRQKARSFSAPWIFPSGATPFLPRDCGHCRSIWFPSQGKNREYKRSKKGFSTNCPWLGDKNNDRCCEAVETLILGSVHGRWACHRVSFPDRWKGKFRMFG